VHDGHISADNVVDALRALVSRGSAEAAYRLEHLPDLLGEED
jgi:hypothetical protein